MRVARRSLSVVFALVASLVAPESRADDSPPTHEVKRAPFEVEISIDGAFESREAHEIAARTETWTDLEVLDTTPHGSRVRGGEVVVRIDATSLDRKLRELEHELEISSLDLEQGEEDLAFLERTTKLELAAAERSSVNAAVDLERFVEHGRALQEKSARAAVQSAKDYLEYEIEELEQLEKMYQADDLTEETEEIILKRQRDAVRRSSFSLELAESSANTSLEIRLPRTEIALKNGAERARISFDQTRARAERDLRKQKIELEKLRLSHGDSERELDLLRQDRGRLELRSPIDGIVYRGRWQQGKWSGAAAAAEKLRRGATLRAHDVVMTVLDPHALFVRALVPEAELHHMRRGLEGVAIPKGFPDERVPARVESISFTPFASGLFEAVISLEPEESIETLTPGMSCSIEFVPYRRKSAIAVPLEAVHGDGDERHVFVKTDEDEPERRDVRVGRTSGELIEVLDGLSEGEEILVGEP